MTISAISSAVGRGSFSMYRQNATLHGTDCVCSISKIRSMINSISLRCVTDVSGGALSERYDEKASSALASVQAAARAEWPEAMKREMQACRTTEQQRLWSEKWAAYLAGRVVAEGAPERPSGGGSVGGGGKSAVVICHIGALRL